MIYPWSHTHFSTGYLISIIMINRISLYIYIYKPYCVWASGPPLTARSYFTQGYILLLLQGMHLSYHLTSGWGLYLPLDFRTTAWLTFCSWCLTRRSESLGTLCNMLARWWSSFSKYAEWMVQPIRAEGAASGCKGLPSWLGRQFWVKGDKAQQKPPNTPIMCFTWPGIGNTKSKQMSGRDCGWLNPPTTLPLVWYP